MDKVNMVPGFILKLWKMVNDPQCDDLISWYEDKSSFIILDPVRFSQELSKYFKHNNLSSFIRQLNMYGFRKVNSIENGGLHTGPDDLHFQHPDFVRDNPERLEAIKRKLPQKLADSVDLRNVFKGITEIEGKQKDVSKTLTEIKRENEMLWAELSDLRQKHQQQQLYISRLMKLVFEAMEQNGIKTNMLQLKRDSPLMIEGGEDTHQNKRARLVAPEDGELNYATAIIDGVAVPDTTQLATTDINTNVTAPIDISISTSPITTSPTATTSSSQISVIPQQIPPTIEQMPDFEVNIDPSLNYEAQSLVHSIHENGEQLDDLIPSFAEFPTENIDDYFRD